MRALALASPFGRPEATRGSQVTSPALHSTDRRGKAWATVEIIATLIVATGTIAARALRRLGWPSTVGHEPRETAFHSAFLHDRHWLTEPVQGVR